MTIPEITEYLESNNYIFLIGREINGMIELYKSGLTQEQLLELLEETHYKGGD